MSVTPLPDWEHHGGYYRPVNIYGPWVASPPFPAKPLPPTYVQFQPITVTVSPPLRDSQPPQSSESKRKKRNFGVFQVLKEWLGFGTTVTYDAPTLESEQPKTPSQEVSLDEWKAWGYFACPHIDGLEVRNYPYTTQAPSSLTLYEALSRLRSPGGTVHSDNWMPGFVHPSLPPRPSRWIDPKLGEPQPFPWECQLNPFLQHLPYGPPPLFWNVGKGPAAVLFGHTKATIPLSTADKCQPATWPFVTHMYINGIAEDPMPAFRWPIMIHNPRGITCGDVFETIFQNFQEHVAVSEYESWEDIHQKPASLAFEARNGAIHNDNLRRVDVLGTHNMFRGLAPHPNREGWTMFVGLA